MNPEHAREPDGEPIDGQSPDLDAADRGAPDLHAIADDPIDDVAVYVLDATATATGADAIEARLDTDPAASRQERRLREVVAELGSATPTPAPPPSLRDRVLGAARARRPGTALVPATTPEVHLIELERAVVVLRELEADDWDRALDPPELQGWTVHDLAAHITSNEALLAANLGHPMSGVPETSPDNEIRTAAVQARHRAMTPAETIAELEAATAAVDRAVRHLDDDALAAEIDWWAIPTTIRTALVIRAFETWTHTDDIRRAIGRPHRPPPAPSRHTMGRSAAAWLPLMLVASGRDLPDLPVRINLTGPGGATYDIDLTLGSEVRPAGSLEPAAELTVDLVDLCRAVANRVPAGGLPYEAAGDLELARSIIAAVPALAAL